MKKRIISLFLVFCMTLSFIPAGALAAEADGVPNTTASQSGTPESMPFTDVKPSDWYYSAVRYARANNFFNGITATTFGANGTLTFAYDPQAGAAAGPASALPAGSAVETEASGEPAADRTVASGTGGSVGSDAVGRGRTPRYEPDPCVKGLTYGRPVKTTDAYTFVGSKSARRIDAFLIVAIVAALLAVGVIVYGYVNDRRAKQMQAELMEEVSQSAAADEAAAESVAE